MCQETSLLQLSEIEPRAKTAYTILSLTVASSVFWCTEHVLAIASSSLAIVSYVLCPVMTLFTQFISYFFEESFFASESCEHEPWPI